MIFFILYIRDKNRHRLKRDLEDARDLLQNYTVDRNSKYARFQKQQDFQIRLDLDKPGNDTRQGFHDSYYRQIQFDWSIKVAFLEYHIDHL